MQTFVYICKLVSRSSGSESRHFAKPRPVTCHIADFNGWNSLTDVFNISPIPQNIFGEYVYAGLVLPDRYVFYGLTLSDIKLHIPKCSGDLYRNAPVWQDFNIVEAEICESNNINDIINTKMPNIIGYYSITGQKLSQEPEKGFYVVVYDNGRTEKKVKK